MRITVTLKDVVFVIVTIIVVFGLYRIFKNKEPMAVEDFALSLSNEGYEIVDRQDISGDWVFILQNYYGNKTPKILDYDMGLELESFYVAKKSSGESEIVYKMYQNEEDAERSFLRYKDSRQFKTSNFEVARCYQAANHEKNRTGKNYEIYYNSDLENDYFLVSRIENTVLIAYVENIEADNLNKVFNRLGYGIHSY